MDKEETGRKLLPQPIEDYDSSKSIGLISFGTNEPAIIEARDWLTSEGVETNYLRVRSLPLAESVLEFVKKHDRIYVIENNFDGQLNQIMRIEYAEHMANVKSLALGDGLPMAARWIVNSILEHEG